MGEIQEGDDSKKQLTGKPGEIQSKLDLLVLVTGV